MSLETAVRNALLNARENGFFLPGRDCDCELSHNGLGIRGRDCDCPAGVLNPYDIAVDMVTYDQRLENEDVLAVSQVLSLILKEANAPVSAEPTVTDGAPDVS